MSSPKQPLVSIIVPVYNSQRTIKQCLQSIKNQTYKKTETIVVDRHSKDKTAQIAKNFKTRLLYVTKERSTAKNYAAKEAKGDFLLFIDSDMRLASETVEECVKKSLETNADAIVIPLKSISHGLLSECRKKERESLSSLSEFMEAPRFFRKTAFLRTGGYDENIVCGEDFDLTKRFKKKGYKIEKITSELYHLEDGASLHNIFSKAYYYGKALPALIRKDPHEAVRRYANIRFASIKTTGATFKNARLLLSFIFMKTFEYIAYFTGILVQLIRQITRNKFFQNLRIKLSVYKFVIINFAILILVSYTIFRNFLLSAEWPGGGDVIGFVSRAYLYGKDFRWLYMWRQYSFGFVEGINFMDFFLMLIYWIFRDPSWTVKIFMFLAYLTAASSMYFFAYRYTHKHVAALSASLVYILNQWLFSQLTEAHVDIIYSYAVAPLIFLLLDNVLKTGKSRDIILLSLGISLFITSFHPECIVIYGVFLLLFTFIFLIFSSKSEKFKPLFYRVVKVFVPSGVLVFLLSAFFLLPFLFNIRAPYFHSSYVYPLEDSFGTSYQNITDAFTLRAVEKWGYVNLVDVYLGLGVPDFPVHTFLFLLFILAYSILLIRRDRYTIFFALSSLISIFLAKGAYSPFGQFFVWAWFNVPHFAIFRAANRWVMMAIFSHAFFISILVSYLASYIEGKTSLQAVEQYLTVKVKDKNYSKNKKLAVSVDLLNSFFKKIRKTIYALSIFLLVFIFLSGFLSCFFFFSQGLQVYTPPEEDLAVYKWLASQSGDYKVISVCRSPSEWYDPLSGESDFASSGMLTPLGWSHDIGFDSSFIHDKPLLQNGGWDFKARQFVDYLRFRLARGHLTDNLLKMLGPFAYYYIVIPTYITEQTRRFFLNQKGYQIAYNQSTLVLKNDYVTQRIFAANQSMFVVGGFESFDALCKIESFTMNKTILYYAPESIDYGSSLYEKANASQMFCFANSDILDLAMVSLGKNAVVIHEGDYGASSLNMTKYWVKWPSWRIIGASVLGGEVLTTVGKNKIDIPFELNSDGIYNIFLRIGFAPSRGNLRLFVDGKVVHEFRPYYPLMSKLEWVNITSLNLAKGEHLITLENDGTGYNDIDAIAIVKPSYLENRINEIVSSLQNFQGRLLYLLEAENTFLNASSSSNWYWTISPYNGYIIRSESLGLNVAPLARVNATSETEFMEAQRAIDGNLGTRWTSEKYALPQWLELTWNTTQSLRGIRIAFENAYATDYAIQTWNGTSWINQTTVTGNNELERVHDFAEIVETNKLRIYVTGFSIFDRVSIWELEAYSTEINLAASTLTIPRTGNYMLAARIATSPKHGKLYFKINDSVHSIDCNSTVSRFEWHEIGPFSLDARNITLAVGGEGLVELDELLLYSLKESEDHLSLDDLFNSPSPKASVTYEKLNPCTFKVHVNASEPFTLVFTEAYDPLWKAFIDGETLTSTPTYSLVNSFYINKTGQFTVTIYFTGQTNADIGLKVALTSFIFLVVALPLVCSNRLDFIKQKIPRMRRLT